MSGFTKLLNVGCGARYDPAWTNIDVVPAGPDVLEHDISQGIPFAAGTFDVVYHSHVLEHLPRSEAPSFIRECGRVLRSGGVLRVVVPDLEGIVRGYLSALDDVRRGREDRRADYEWMMLELLDQLVRTRSGGGLRDFLRRDHLPNEKFVLERSGAEADHIIRAARLKRAARQQAAPASSRIQAKIEWGKRIIRDGGYRREWIWRHLLQTDYQALQLGRFRLRGEVHQWMYDSYSLGALLTECGFEDARRCEASESSVPEWARFQLDAAADGTVHKPDSLYMEATRR